MTVKITPLNAIHNIAHHWSHDGDVTSFAAEGASYNGAPWFCLT